AQPGRVGIGRLTWRGTGLDIGDGPTDRVDGRRAEILAAVAGRPRLRQIGGAHKLAWVDLIKILAGEGGLADDAHKDKALVPPAQRRKAGDGFQWMAKNGRGAGDDLGVSEIG